MEKTSFPAPRTLSENCGLCFFLWDNGELPGPRYVCKRFPPQVNVIPMGIGPGGQVSAQVMSAQPPIKDPRLEWCGEFKAKASVPQN
jgi:hypothetical protein